MNKNELITLQSLPLDIKIAKSKLRIDEFIRYLGGSDKVYISFSGGKDSTVLLHLVRSIYPEIEAVFIDTGLEYPELKDFVKTQNNVTTIRPKLSFKQVLEKYGYPVVSKEQSQFIEEYRNTKSEKHKLTRWNGNKYGMGKISEKWKYLVDAPFLISDKCCKVMKKNPAKTFEKQTNKSPILGVMAVESKLRETNYMQNGCNSFGDRNTCKPLGFWTEQDILKYIKTFGLKVAECYGQLIDDDGVYKFTKCQRTGCIFCMYGITQEKGKNRFENLEETHPQLHDYCMNKLGFKQVCEYMGIKYSKATNPDGQYDLFSKIDEKM